MIKKKSPSKVVDNKEDKRRGKAYKEARRKEQEGNTLT
jgi:hypothetical protein